MQLTGSQVIIECLKEQGVDTVFGYPGGAILNVYDELYNHPEIKHVLTSHEQGASHAADGYARATGKVGVCMATSGPGATNLVTGIASAYMDSIPVVAITCNVTVPLLGKDSFQEIDIAGITMPITKYSFIVKDVEELADTIRRAFSIARKGRPGPVLVDIPKDITAQKVEYTSKKVELPAPCTKEITEEALNKAVEMIKKAKTDQDRNITYDPVNRPEVANLLMLISLCTGENPVDIAARIGEGGGGMLKNTLTEALNEELRPLRQKRMELEKNPDYIRSVLIKGAERAREIGIKTLEEVRDVMNMKI